MMNSKVMIGKDVLSKLNFEQDFCDCKSVLVIYDLQGNLCDIKYKLKKYSQKFKIVHMQNCFVSFQTKSIMKDLHLKCLKD